MLVLERELDEEIVIEVPPGTQATQITVQVTEFRNDEISRKVVLGFEAPRKVTIHRREVFNAIRDGKPRKRDQERLAANGEAKDRPAGP